MGGDGQGVINQAPTPPPAPQTTPSSHNFPGGDGAGGGVGA